MFVNRFSDHVALSPPTLRELTYRHSPILPALKNMSASSSAASNTVVRSRTAIVFLTAIAAAYGVYCLHQASEIGNRSDAHDAAHTTGLRRSNAVHRRRRRVRTSDDNDDDGETENDTDGNELAPTEDHPAPDTILRPLGDGETVVDDQEGGSSWQYPSGTRQRNGQNIVQLLFRVSEDATRRNAYIHRGCMCNSCGDLIRGIRYRCSNCIDYDLCETCEALDRHIKTHIFYKVRVPTTAYASRQTQPVWYPGDPDSSQAPSSLPKDLLTRLSRETGFERPELDAYWEQWTFMANTEWREDPDDLKIAMDRKTFDECLVPSGSSKHSPPNLIYDRMFAFYDSNNDDLISFPEYLNGLAFRKKKDKLKKVFEGYDIDGDGFVERKDFLRIFRCYYVLQKERQRDMLESMDDRVMNSTWVQKLVEGRQPLSSAFGHDGNFEPGPNPRRMEGKMQPPGGETEVTDGKGVISESSNDYGNKDDVLIDALSLKNQSRIRRLEMISRISRLEMTNHDEYWQIMLNPPQTIADLNGEVLERLIESRHNAETNAVQRSDDAGNEPSAVSGAAEEPSRSSSELPTVTDGDTGLRQDASASQEQNAPPLSDDARVSSPHKALADETQQHERTVNDQIHERWKRRQFYTDEEEGASAPADWNEDEDVAAHVQGSSDTNISSAFRPAPLSARSRSSSKVRFAEDTDDFDTRSNPSTSSRSVPERWGGMEIPEAERDAGKEILYQVAQQAFNELLDPLFKAAEDRAITAMSNAKMRSKMRHLLKVPEFETWAQLIDGVKPDKDDAEHALLKNSEESRKDRFTIPEVELEDVRQRPLEHLLATTGFMVVEDSATIEDNSSSSQRPLDSVSKETASQDEAPDNIEAETETQTGPEQPGVAMEDSPYVYEEVDAKQATVDQSESTTRDTQAQAEPPIDKAEENLSLYHDPTLPYFRPNSMSPAEPPMNKAEENSLLYRDPTLPQFRPNSMSDISQTLSIATDASQIQGNVQRARPTRGNIVQGPVAISRTGSQSQNGSDHSEGRTPGERKTSKKSARKGQRKLTAAAEKLKKVALRQMIISGLAWDTLSEFQTTDWMDLYDLRSSERCENQAKERGGWGRLNWLEFEQVIKERESDRAAKEKGAFPGETPGMSMDYLGSWIEFCIP